MRGYLVAAAVIALTQPAFAATSHKKNSHRHHASSFSHHHYAGRHHRGYAQAFASANAFEPHAFGAPSFPNQSFPQQPFPQQPFPQQPWQQTWGTPSGPFGGPAPRVRNARVHDTALDGMIAQQAAANGLPVELVHRVVTRESGYNPHARSGSNLGLMQIKYATARGVGYTGPASGLMDPQTNLTYAVRYLAGAYRAAGGNANRAVRLYASGYHRRGAPPEVRVASATPWQVQPPALGGW